MRIRLRIALALIGVAVFSASDQGRAADAANSEAEAIDFSQDVRPILSEHCFACHGPDAKTRKADLRLDVKEDAFRERDGYAVIVPGDLDASELLYRITTDDKLDKMPPSEGEKHLSEEQVQILQRWVEQGAPWEEHWAFIAPEKAPRPEVRQGDWAKDPLDDFILARLEEKGLLPSPEASKEALLRRLTLDLTGLPPTPEEVEAFLTDESEEAYEKVVDRLLRSPRYGEHMARFWLDAARYGDTHGLHLDNYREMWPYRDWVIRSFNQNQPFDEFIVEQTAGDLLPDATLDQIIATGFNRCNVTTNEGGSIKEEVYVRNVVDQVETNGTVFLGLTIGCARCHDHKYDPISMANFYELFAFFNSIDGSPMDGNTAKHAPFVQVPSPEQSTELARLDGQLKDIKTRIAEAIATSDYDPTSDEDQGEYIRRDDYVWIDDALPPGAEASEPWEFVSKPDHPVLKGEKALKQTHEGQGQRYFNKAGQTLRIGEGDTFFAYVFLDPINPPKQVMFQWHTGEAWSHRAYWGENLIEYGKDGTPDRQRIGDLPKTGEWVRLEVDAATLKIKPETVIDGWAFTQHGGTVSYDKAGLRTWTPQQGQSYPTLASWVRSLKVAMPEDLPKPVQDIVKVERNDRSEAQRKRLRDHYVEHFQPESRSTFAPLHKELAQAEAAHKKLNEAIPTTLVFQEAKEPKPAFLLERGEYDLQGDPVERAVPAFLNPFPEDAPRDRLGFARWLVDEQNPLTARVAVNRFWQQIFGTGLVKTAEDFGAQGEPPSHPLLLDRLAVEFLESGWDVKTLMKRFVMSSTYRQSARVTPEKLAKDPANRFLSRGPRTRLDAETLRDQALFVSGLLVEQVGGPSVKPPQPEGLWEAVGYSGSNTVKFTADEGHEKVHRRSLYIFWKRTSAPPQMTTFDAPSREACIVRRERTNTPLQALLLMNEPQYVEAARALAERIMRQDASDVENRLDKMFRLAVARAPKSEELAELNAAYQDFFQHYQEDTEAARRLISNGETKPDPELEPSELAAWTMIGNLLLNLDEVVNKS